MALKPKKIKYILITVVFIAIAFSTWYFFNSKRNPNVLKKTEQKININASMFLENVQQTASQDGIQEWTLNAKSATFFEADKKTLINEPVVTFYTKQSNNVHMTATEGVYNTDTNEMEVTGNVVIKNKLYELNTEKLNYEPDMHIIKSTTPVTISSKTFNFQADKMIIDLDTNKARLIGNVKGIIRGDFFLEP